MSEKHFAYKIKRGFIYPHFDIQKTKMVDLLKEIYKKNDDGLFWVFKQVDDKPQEQLCIIDCPNHRIYFHYSGDVKDLVTTIKKLEH